MINDIGLGYVLVGAVLAIAFVVGVVLGWLDRKTEAPIMKARVNDGSDQYLREHDSILREGLASAREAHDFLGDANKSPDDDDAGAA